MKNRLLLSVALLFSVPAVARMTFEEAQHRLQAAQSRIKEIREEQKSLDEKAQGTHRALQSISGKPEFGQDLERRNTLVRSRLDRYNQLHAQLDAARAELQKVLSEVGRKFNVTSEREGEYSLSRPTRTVVTAPDEHGFTAQSR